MPERVPLKSREHTPSGPDLPESELRAIYDSALDAFLVADDEGRYLSANPAACSLLGISEADLLGRRVSDFLGNGIDFGPAWRTFLEQGTMRGETVLIRPDGTTRQVDFNAISNVLPGRHLSILRDVSERRRAEDALKLLAEAGQILSEGLDYHVTLQNVARLAVPVLADWCVLDLISEEGDLERLVTIHADPACQPLVEELKKHAARKGEGFDMNQVLRMGRSLMIAEATPEDIGRLSRGPEHRRVIEALELHSVLGVPLIARGRTLGAWSFVRTRASLPYGDVDLQLAETLARRAALAIDNARLYRKAEAANQAKDQFLAALSHELRTPLTPVLTLVSRLERSPDLGNDLRRNLGVIRKNVELEARLIDDLLDLTRITHGRIELHCEVTSLNAVLQHAIEICCREGMADCLTDLRAGDPRVWADGPRLTQVFWNLLSNAVKFTPPGGTIRVSTRIEGSTEGQAEDRKVVVEISDTGIGIDAEMLPSIFGAFEQGLGTGHKFGGLGLGLTISKAILDVHGGSLQAQSEGRERGATFVVRLPLYEGPGNPETLPVEPADTAAPDVPDRPRSILLIEDHPDTAEAIADLLRERGHRVVVAGSLAAGRAAAEEAGIDLVVSDLGLPDGSGLTLMRELKERYGLPGIAVSGYGTEEDRRESAAAGFSAHLTKPVTIDALLGWIRRVGGAPSQKG